MNKAIRYCLIVVLLVGGNYASRAQLSGTFNIPSATYPTLASIVTDLNTQGVGTGGAIVNVTSGNPQAAPAGGIKLGSTVLNASLTAAKPLVLNGNGNTLTAATGIGTFDAIFTLLGTDYVTVNGFVLQENALNTPGAQMMERGIWMIHLNTSAPFDGVQNCTIQNCSVSLSKLNTNAPIGILSQHVADNSNVVLNITAVGDTHSGNKFYGNAVNSAAAGIRLEGYAAAPAPYTLYDQNNDIGGTSAATGNTITNIGGIALFNMFGLLAIDQNGLNVSYNTMDNALGNTAGNSTQSIGIYTRGTNGSATVNNNTIILTQANAGAVVLAPIYTLSTGDVTINNNTVSFVEAAGAATHYGIWFQSSTTGTVNNNTINTTNSGPQTGNYWYIYAAGAPVGTTTVANITNNKFSNISLNTTGQIMLIYMNTAIPTINVVSNRIVGTFTRLQTSLSTYLVYGSGTATTGTVTIAQNNFSNISVNGAAGLYGIYYFPGTTQNQVVHTDTLSNWNTNGGLAPVYGMYVSSGAANKIYNNIVSNISTAYVSGAYGMYLHAGTVGIDSIYNNTISGFSSAGTTYGMSIFAGNIIHVYRNKLTDISTTGTAYDVYGLYVSAGAEGLYYNNFITDIKATLSSNLSSANGAYFTTTGTQRFFHNTVNLDFASSTATRGATGVYYSTAVGSFDFRNNIVRVNVTPAGSGTVAALRRSSGSTAVQPANLATTTNGNIYFTPAVANSWAYGEGTSGTLINAYNTTNDVNFNTPCGTYKAFMTPRESGSFIENNLTQIGTTGTFQPTGTSRGQNGAAPSPITVAADYNLVTRGNPADVGALEFTSTALDGSPPNITYTNLTNTYCLTAPTLTTVITDASGVNTTTNPPRIYYKKSTETNAFSATNTSAFNGWKWVSATGTAPNFTFTPNYSLLNSAVAAGNTIQYFVVAQDNAATPNVATNTAGYPSGFCPPSVDLPAAAGPLAAAPVIKSYNILTQPAPPVLTPATATVCPGTPSMITATTSPIPGTVTIGTGTSVNASSSYPAPVGLWWQAQRHQMIVPASELLAQGLTPGMQISNITFPISSSSGVGNIAEFQMSLGNTAQTAYSGAGTWVTTLTQVVNLTNYTPPAGNATFTFIAPFTWTGGSLVVETINNNPSFSVNSQHFYTPTAYNSSIYYFNTFSGTVASLISSSSTGGTVSGNRPNMIFGYNINQPLTWNVLTGLYKDVALTQPMTAADTNKVVWAAPPSTTVYTASNMFTGCTGPVSNNATVNLLTATPTAITPAGAQSICPGNALTLSAPTGTGFTYQWRLNGTDITGATSQTFSASATGSYTVRVYNPATGCTATTVTPTVISFYTPPPATITPVGSTTVCYPSAVTLNANTGTGLTYQWKLNGNNITSATAASYPAAITGNYTVAVTSSVGCVSTSTPVLVTVNTTPDTIIAAGTTTFCPGGSVTLIAPTIGPFTYQWRLNGTDIPGSIAVTHVAAVGGLYTVRVTNTATGCTSTTTPGTTVVVGPPPSAAITPVGSQPLCAGSTLTLSTNPAPGLFYQWKLNGTDIPGANAVTYGATAAGNYTVAVSTSPTCVGLTATPTNVFINPLPPSVVTASGPTTFCLGDSVLLTGNSGAGFTYQWRLNNAPVPGANTISYYADQVGPWTLAVTNSNGCTGISAPMNVVVNPLPPVSAVASGPTTFCAGGSVTLTGNTGTGITWQWRNTGIDVAGATASNYVATASGSYTLRTTSTTTGCFNTSTAIAVVSNPRPPVTTTPFGSTAICQGDTLLLSVPASAGATTQWSNAGGPIAGATNTTFATMTAGTYTAYRVYTATGCDATSAPVTVTVNPVPAAVISPSTPSPICPYEFSNLSANTGTGLTYQWTLNNTNLGGATASTLAANAAGTYRVVVRNTFNCPTTSQPVTLVVKPAPAAQVTYSTPISFCEGGAVVLTAAPGTGYTYEWFKDNNVQAGLNTIYNSASTTGSYHVRVTNSVGCTATSLPVPVLVYPTPVPVVSYTGTMVTTTPFLTYQWFYNNIAIPGGSTQSIPATKGGAYRVTVTDANGCTGGSTQFFVVGVGVGGPLANGDDIRIYPNPSRGIVYIESKTTRVHATVRDVSGRTLLQADDAKELDLRPYAEGMYMLYLYDDKGSLIRTEKITKKSE